MFNLIQFATSNLSMFSWSNEGLSLWMKSRGQRSQFENENTNTFVSSTPEA